MGSSAWLVWLVPVLLLGHGVLLYHLIRRADPNAPAVPEERGTPTARDANQAPEADPDQVRCVTCETINERGYRFCRECVTELPHVTGHQMRRARLTRRGIR